MAQAEMLGFLMALAVLSLRSHAVPTPISFLYWSPFWPDGQDEMMIHTSKGTCVGTTDRNLGNHVEVIIFYGRTDVSPYPTFPRRQGTFWVYQFYESPSYYSNRQLDFVEKVGPNINILMNYDTRSDVYAPYGHYFPLSTPLQSYDSGFHSKPKLIVWAPSNCDARYRNYRLSQLRPTLPLDILSDGASCRTEPTIPECRGDRNNNQSHYECFIALGRTYKFYFAMENSDCTDYITEKIWRNSFAGGMIPVVWASNAHYDKLLPPKSFINCADFPSGAACVDHIIHVGQDEKLYNSYHDWRLTYGFEFWTKPIFHELCEYVYDHRGEEKSAIDLRGIRDVNQQCFMPQD